MAQFDSPERRYGPLSDMLSGVRFFGARPVNCVDDFFRVPEAGKFCGRWTADEIAGVFMDTGCISHWRSLGYDRLWIEVDPQEIPGRYGLSVWTQVGEVSELLVQLVVWLDYIEIERLGCSYPSFCVEHLRLQAPGREFARAALPGQDFASSGMLRRMFGIIRNWACMLGAGVITEIPEYFHTGYIFSEYFTYADEEMEGLFRAAKRDLMPGRTLSEVSSAFQGHRVLYCGKPWIWPTEVQAYGLSHELSQKLMAPESVIDAGVFEIVE